MQDIKNFKIKWRDCFKDVEFEHYPRIPRKEMKYPAIYSWQIFDNKELKLIYIGETIDLGRRLYHYKRSGISQHTNKRIKQELIRKEKNGFIVNFSKLDFNGLKFNNSLLINKNGFIDKTNRLIIENLIILYYRNTPVKVLNKI